MNKKLIADYLHKGAVTALIGLTVIGTGFLGMQVLYYFTVYKPERRKVITAASSNVQKDQALETMRNLFRSLRIFNIFRDSVKAACFSDAKSSATNGPKKSWNVLRVNHIAVATGNLEKATFLYEKVLQAEISPQVPLPDHGVTTVFVDLGNTKIELLQPLGDNSPIQNFLNKNSVGGMHHICLEVDDIIEAVEDLKKHNIRLLSDKPKIGAHGKPVIFLHPKDCGGVLIELEAV